MAGPQQRLRSRSWRLWASPVIFDKFQQSKSYMFSKEPQIQFIDRVVDFLVAQRRRLPTVQTVQKTGEIPQVLFLDKVDDTRCYTTTGAWVMTELKTVEVPQLQYSDKVVDVPVCAVHRRSWTS